MLWKNGNRVGIAMLASALIMVGCSDTQQQRNPMGPSADLIGGNGKMIQAGSTTRWSFLAIHSCRK